MSEIFFLKQEIRSKNQDYDLLFEEIKRGMLYLENHISSSKPKNKIIWVDGVEAVNINETVWMTKNLDTDTFANGEKIPEITETIRWRDAQFPAWCYYDNNPDYGKLYGKLYNFYAVSDERGLCPIGWEVASLQDFKSLANFYGGGIVAVNVLKDSVGWYLGSGNNISGFSALPSGFRPTPEGSSEGLDFDGLSGGVWWSSTKYIHEIFGLKFSNNTSDGIDICFDNLIYPNDGWFVGKSVRCVKRKN